MARPLVANLIAGGPGRNHDFDFARIRLAQALFDAEGIRTDCFQNYEDSAAILGGDLLVSYTSQVPVSEAAGFALHASNSVGPNQYLPQLLGTRFISHPPYMRFPVNVVAPADPLLSGINSFEVDDELYCVEVVSKDIEVLLQTRWGGEAFGNKVFEVEDRPMMYRHRIGDGGVLYLALGHANRPYDKPFPHSPDQTDKRGPWDMPIFKTLIERGIAWAAHRMD
jgi:type 1 glutamine amidotransferase